jgi:hypothetical protein
VEIEIGREYNFYSQHRSRNDDSYIFRGIVTEHRHSDVWSVRITEFTVSKGHDPGDVIGIDESRFKSLVARTNREAKRLLQGEF